MLNKGYRVSYYIGDKITTITLIHSDSKKYKDSNGNSYTIEDELEDNKSFSITTKTSVIYIYSLQEEHESLFKYENVK